ncbi:MAG: PT domain-containing protein, partial [Oscillospiraceae bacterium]|nr:PT domain-containing protein [Oscillospiraceae bacterium]
MKKRITAFLLSAAIMLSSVAPSLTVYAEELAPPLDQPQQLEQQDETQTEDEQQLVVPQDEPVSEGEQGEEPSTEPELTEPTTEPSTEPSADPTEEPSVEPTEEPTVEPTEEPAVEPTVEPTTEPTEEIVEETLQAEAESEEKPAAMTLLEDLGIPTTANIYEGSLDLTEMDADFSADGIEWDCETNTLTLTDVTIVTDYEDVLYLPEESVIVSKGTANYLISEEYGIYAEGELTITGGTPLYMYAAWWGFDVCERLIIDGTPFTAETGDGHGIYNYKGGQSLDSSLVLKNGSYIKTTPCFPFYCDECWYFMTEDREYADWDDMES